MPSEVKNFYKGSSVLITGATGFFGKLLIQKLLQSCVNIKIYIIIRQKQNESVETRVEQIFDNPLFDQLKKSTPNFKSQVIPMEGDFASDNLGLNEVNQQILFEKINIVFHCAANLNMQAKLRCALTINVKGTQDLLRLCKKMKHLQSLMMVSTVYANCQQYMIEERLYKPDPIATDFMNLVEELNEESLESLKSVFIGKSPNVYCFTKALAEHLAIEEGQGLPIGIFRPSIVTSTYMDPLPGWTDNVNGILGVMLAIMIGVMRVTYGKVDTKVDFVPADMCVNALICAAWQVSKKKSENGNRHINSIPIYNFCNRERLRITWKELKDVQIKNYKYAFKAALWAPFNILTPNVYLFNTLEFLLHSVPAVIYDTCRFLCFKKPKLLSTYRKMQKMQSVLVYFNLHEWNIKRKNVDNLWESLSEEDKMEFTFDVDTIDYDQYFGNIAYGIKKYYLKESMENLKDDERKLKRLKLLHQIAALILCAVLLYLFFTMLPIIMESKSINKYIKSLIF